MTSSGALLTSLRIPIGLLEILLSFFRKTMDNPTALYAKSCKKTETGWTLTEGSTTTKDTWTEIRGDEEDAAVKDSAAVI